MKKFGIIAFLSALIMGLTAFFIFRDKNQYDLASPYYGEITESIYGMGKVMSHRKYEVKVGVMTKVKKVFVQEGQEVPKGTPLIQFTDSAPFKAPFAGTITRVAFNEPDTVLPHVVVLSMADLKNKYIEVSLEQEGALRVRKNQPATIIFESLRGSQYEGKVDAIYPKDDEFIAHINIPDLGANILPGMTADVAVVVSENKKGLLVPLASLANGHILVKNKGKYGNKKIPVQIGSIDGEWAEILNASDLKTDDQILVRKRKEDH